MLLLRGKPSGASQTDAPSADDEAALMHAARCDPSQFAPVYQRYASRIFAYCASRTSRQEAEDLTSQVFVCALTGLEGFRGGSVSAWLFSIAHNVVVSHYRAQGQRATVSLETIASDLADDRATVLERVAELEAWGAVCREAALLPEGDQDLLALWLNGGLSAAEIGAIVGKKAGTVRVRLHRILGRLRQSCAEVEL